MIEKDHIYHENCLDTLSKLENESINHVITSPPYNMNLRIMGDKYCSRQIVKEFSTKYDGFDDNLPQEEYFNLHKKILGELLRVTKGYVFYNIQVVTGNKPSVFKLMGEFSEKIKEIVIWDKTSAQPAMGECVMNSEFEFLIILSNNKKDAMSRQFKEANFARGTLSNVWRIKRGKKASKEHGATFPEELVEKILVNFTNEGEIIYDPFFGTGTVGIVSKKLGRHYIGSELLKKYIDIAEERLNSNKTLIN
jgi:site-specific DNA-methyltransferase (adenine-specific)/modification methylase